jgi:hypothetical protein
LQPTPSVRWVSRITDNFKNFSDIKIFGPEFDRLLAGDFRDKINDGMPNDVDFNKIF